MAAEFGNSLTDLPEKRKRNERTQFQSNESSKSYVFNIEEVGFFSMDGKKKFHNNNSMMKYFHKPPNEDNLYLDLNIGSKNVIKKDFGSEVRLNPILNWLKLNPLLVGNKSGNSSKSESSHIDFVCSRGILTNIALAYYDDRNEWVFHASKYKSVIYLSNMDTNLQITRNKNNAAYCSLNGTWSFKFEQFMTSDKPDSKPDTSVPVNENEEYFRVLKVKLDEHTLLYNAETDGKENDTNSYVELKMFNKKNMELLYKKPNLRMNVLKFYFQSYFGDVAKIILGLRDENGIVRKIETIPVGDIPKSLELSETEGMNFCAQKLDEVKKVLVEDDFNVVYKFYWDKISKKMKNEKLTLIAKKDRVLPDWYITHLNKGKDEHHAKQQK